MYLLINSDQSVNYASDHPVNSMLNVDGLQLIEFPDKTLPDVVGDIPPEEAMWDAEEKQVVRHPVFLTGSEEWRRRQASIKITEYYPLSKQLNILRSSDKAAKKTMVLFIDACRDWSNDLTDDPAAIKYITP